MNREKIRWFSIVRTYGLLLVLGYHLFFTYVSGGFLGVDIFSTFSGFLTTALIIEEVRSRKSFNAIKFYKRRLQRILIPLFFAILFTMPLLLLISPDFSVGISKQVTSALGFATNWFQISTGGSYEARLLPSMYVHIWSLSIEMQFYVIWGIVCVILALFSKKKVNAFRAAVGIAATVGAVLSFLYMRYSYSSGVALDTIYFNTFTRLFPFLIGSLAAVIKGMNGNKELKPVKHPKLSATGLILLTAAAMGVILYNCLTCHFEDGFVYEYGFLITSLCTVVMIYSTHTLHKLTPKKVNEPKVLSASADLSYNIYLFHYPVYVAFSVLIMNNLYASLATLGVAAVMSAVMFFGIERIFIPKNRPRAIKRRGLAIAVLAVVTVITGTASGAVIWKEPALTSIEGDFAIGSVSQDALGVISFKDGVEAINERPVAFSPESSLPLDILLAPSSVQEVLATVPPDEIPTSYFEEHNIQPPTKNTQEQSNTNPTDATNPQNTTQGTQSTQKPPNTSTQPSVQPSTQPPTTVTAPPKDPVELKILGGVTIIGDSVALGAQTTLTKEIPDCFVDAKVSRFVKESLDVLKNIYTKGNLREYVVIAVGTNGNYTDQDYITKMIEYIPAGCRIVVVTPFDGRSNTNSKILNQTSEWMRSLPDIYEYVSVADWNSLISTQTNYLASDKVHMGGDTSRKLYTQCIVEALNEAAEKPAKPE